MRRPKPVPYAAIYAELTDGYGDATDLEACSYWYDQGHKELPERIAKLEASCTALEKCHVTAPTYRAAVERLTTLLRQVREAYLRTPVEI